MALTTFIQAIGAAQEMVLFAKVQSRTSVAAAWFSVMGLNGNPVTGAGTLAGSNTANGVVPTDATAGCPPINTFGVGATGYLAQVDFTNTVAARMKLFDLLFKAGAYSFDTNTTLDSQPSYSSRIPGGDYTGTQIWIETVTAFTGSLSVAVTYTNQAGTTGRTTGTVACGSPIIARMIQLPLQAGDSGVQKIESVVATGATVGTFNVLVLRPLWSGRAATAAGGGVHDLALTGMPVVFDDSALFAASAADSTNTGIVDFELLILNG